MKSETAFIDLFAGIGGFRLALERIGFRCVWSCETDRYCEKIYRKNFGEGFDAKDAKAVDPKGIPDFDLLCAGFPCQSFSIAGKRKGFDDTRGTLFWEICRVAREKRPRLLLLENVKGLLSHEAGRTFAIILLSLDELGYDAEWQVCNSKNYGVPQNRERVFIVGHLRGEGGQQVFPLRKSERILNKKNKKAPRRNSIVTSITKDYHKAPLNRGETYIIHDKRQAKEFRIQKEPCVTKHYGTGGGNVPLIANAVDCDGYLRQMGVHHDKPLCHYRIRRLTPIECERLQGFPDGWTEGVSDTQRYKMLGNAVTVNVVEAIGERMRKVLNEG